MGSSNADDLLPPPTESDQQSVPPLDSTEASNPDSSALLSPAIRDSLGTSAENWPQPGTESANQATDSTALPEGLVTGLIDPAKAKKRTRKPAPIGKSRDPKVNNICSRYGTNS